MNEADPSFNKKNKTNLKTKLAEFVSVIGQTLKGKRSSGNNLDEKPSEPDLSTLSFEQLKNTFEESSKLAEKTFIQTDNGFINAKGDGASIIIDGNFFRCSISYVMKDFQEFIAHGDSILAGRSTDKEAMMVALRAMVEKYGNRIIE